MKKKDGYGYMREKNIKQKSNTLHRAVTWMLLFFCLLSVAGVYGMYLYTDSVKDEYRTLTERCAYEAYLSFSDGMRSIAASGGDGDYAAAVRAAEALSRFELFSRAAGRENAGDYAAIHSVLNKYTEKSGDGVMQTPASVSIINDMMTEVAAAFISDYDDNDSAAVIDDNGGENKGGIDINAANDFDTALQRVSYAETCARRALFLSGHTPEITEEAGATDAGAASYKAAALSEPEKWGTLRSRAEVEEHAALALARGAIGGGARLSRAENHGFPLVYSYVCENAAADVSRMGGKLLRMYCHRLGSGEVRSVSLCRRAAREFVAQAGIPSAELISKSERDGVCSYVFAGTAVCGDETVICRGERITVTVARQGARVCSFDATEYYRERPASHVMMKPKINRAEAMRLAGASAHTLSLVLDSDEDFATLKKLYWCVSGGKILYIDAQTGEMIPQNP